MKTDIAANVWILDVPAKAKYCLIGHDTKST